MSIPMAELMGDTESEILDHEGVYESCEHVAAMLITGSRFFTLGMRAFYLSIPFVFYYFGPLALIVSTIGTIGFVYVGDSSLGANKIGLKKPEPNRRSNVIHHDDHETGSNILLRTLSRSAEQFV
jgi:uncharacterized membrane protein